MDSVLVELSLSSVWFWIVLGCIIILLELLGATAGYFLWVGSAALCVSVILWLWPTLNYEYLLLIFVFLSILFSLGWCAWTRSHQYKSSNSHLNNKKHTLVGVKTIVVEPFKAGVGRIKIADGSYAAQSEYDLSIGDEVTVIGFNDIYLLVNPTKHE